MDERAGIGPLRWSLTDRCRLGEAGFGRNLSRSRLPPSVFRTVGSAQRTVFGDGLDRRWSAWRTLRGSPASAASGPGHRRRPTPPRRDPDRIDSCPNRPRSDRSMSPRARSARRESPTAHRLPAPASSGVNSPRRPPDGPLEIDLQRPTATSPAASSGARLRQSPRDPPRQAAEPTVRRRTTGQHGQGPRDQCAAGATARGPPARGPGGGSAGTSGETDGSNRGTSTTRTTTLGAPRLDVALHPRVEGGDGDGRAASRCPARSRGRGSGRSATAGRRRGRSPAGSILRPLSRSNSGRSGHCVDPRAPGPLSTSRIFERLPHADRRRHRLGPRLDPRRRPAR